MLSKDNREFVVVGICFSLAFGRWISKTSKIDFISPEWCEPPICSKVYRGYSNRKTNNLCDSTKRLNLNPLIRSPTCQSNVVTFGNQAVQHTTPDRNIIIDFFDEGNNTHMKTLNFISLFSNCRPLEKFINRTQQMMAKEWNPFWSHLPREHDAKFQ